MTKRVIHIGDGRHIEIEEGGLRRPPQPPKPKKDEPVPGLAAWLRRKRGSALALSPNSGRLLGQSFGATRDETSEAWFNAKKQADKDMENIKKSGIELDEAGEDALRFGLEVLRGPGDIKTKLQAARMVLEWTKAKPAAKSEVTVNKAEEWLASISKDEDEEA